MELLRKAVKKRLDELDYYIEWVLPDDKNLREPYITKYNKALNLFSLGNYIESGEVLGIKWTDSAFDLSSKSKIVKWVI